MDNKLEKWFEFAINEENNAVKLYEQLASKVTDKGARVMLLDMAAMERGHAEKLKGIRFSLINCTDDKKIANLKMAEYMVEKPLAENSTVQDVILYAIQAEKRAVNLYNDMAAAVSDAEQKRFLIEMACEEERHKGSLEAGYDDIIFKEN